MEQKQSRLGKHNNTWFLGKGIVNTLKIQPTPDSKLKRNIHKALNSKIQADRGKTKFVEMRGDLIWKGLSRPGPKTKAKQFSNTNNMYMEETRPF